MRLLALLCLAACTAPEEPERFEYVVRFPVNDATVIVGDDVNPGELTYLFADYETARRELRIEVELRRGDASNIVELRPGVCWDRVLPLHDIGRLIGERAGLALIEGQPLRLEPTSYECVGTELSIYTTN